MDTIETLKVKVLVNALHAKSGGGATYVRNMLPRLARQSDFEVYIAVDSGAAHIIADLDLKNVIKLSVPKGLAAMILFEQIHIPRLARRLDADIVFSLANYGPLFVRHGVVMLRNALGVGLLDRRLFQRFYWLSLYVATLMSVLTARHVIAISDFARRSGGGLIARLVANKHNVVYHGVNPLFGPAPDGVDRSGFALCVSDLYVQKNYHRLLEAFAVLRDRGTPIELRIAGAAVDAGYANDLKATVTRLGLSDHVRFMGSVGPQELSVLYQQCQMFVFPSLVETFGNPLAEALTCGAPTACSTTAAMPEVAGDAALYFDPNDVVDMADKLDTLYHDADLRRDLSVRALSQSQKYSWDHTAAKTISVLKRAARS